MDWIKGFIVGFLVMGLITRYIYELLDQSIDELHEWCKKQEEKEEI